MKIAFVTPLVESAPGHHRGGRRGMIEESIIQMPHVVVTEKEVLGGLA